MTTATLRRRLQRAWASRPWFWDGWVGLPPWPGSKAHARWRRQGFFGPEWQ